MQFRFTTAVASSQGVFSKGRVIDSTDLAPDRAAAWLNQGVLVPIEQEEPIREAVADRRRQAVTRRGRKRW